MATNSPSIQKGRRLKVIKFMGCNENWPNKAIKFAPYGRRTLAALIAKAMIDLYEKIANKLKPVKIILFTCAAILFLCSFFFGASLSTEARLLLTLIMLWSGFLGLLSSMFATQMNDLGETSPSEVKSGSKLMKIYATTFVSFGFTFLFLFSIRLLFL